jgi:hypothetical protein
MALRSTQPLKEMSTRNPPGGKGRPARGLTTSPPSVSRLSKKCESLDVSQPYWPSQSLTGIAFLWLYGVLINLMTLYQVQRYIGWNRRDVEEVVVAEFKVVSYRRN